MNTNMFLKKLITPILKKIKSRNEGTYLNPVVYERYYTEWNYYLDDYEEAGVEPEIRTFDDFLKSRGAEKYIGYTGSDKQYYL